MDRQISCRKETTRGLGCASKELHPTCRHGNRVSCWVTAYKMIQDGKKTRSDDCNRSDEIWAMSYSMIGGIISANTALVLEVSPLRKGRADGEYSETEQVVENSQWQGDYQKLYSTGREKEEKGVIHISHAGSGKSSESGYQESHSTEWTSENSTMQ